MFQSTVIFSRLRAGVFILAVVMSSACATSWQAHQESAWDSYSQARYAEAEQQFTAALDRAENSTVKDERAALAVAGLAKVFEAQGRLDKAEEFYLKSNSLVEESWGDKHWLIAQNLSQLARLYRLQRRFDDAEPMLQRALMILQSIPSQPIRSKSTIIYDLGNWFHSDWTPYRRGSDHPNVGAAYYDLGNLALQQNKLDVAEENFKNALGVYERVYSTAHPYVGTISDALGRLYAARGESAKAEKAFLKAIEIREIVLGEKDPKVVKSMTHLARLYRSQGKQAEAASLVQRINDINQN